MIVKKKDGENYKQAVLRHAASDVCQELFPCWDEKRFKNFVSLVVSWIENTHPDQKQGESYHDALLRLAKETVLNSKTAKMKESG